MSLLRITVWMLIAAFGLQVSSRADVITLRDGQKQEGVITVDRTDLPTISIRTVSGEIAIPRDRITNIETEPPATGYMRIGDRFFDTSRYTDAASMYRKALELDKDNQEVAAKLRQTEGVLQEEANAKKQQALGKLDDELAQARKLVKEKKYEEATKLLRSLDTAKDEGRKALISAALADAYFQWGVSRNDHQDPAGATEKLETCLRIDPKNQEARTLLVKLWEGDPTKLNEIVNHYRNATTPDEELKLADALFRLRNYDEALPIYLKYVNNPNFSSTSMVQRVRLMYDMLHRKYAEKGDFKKAAEAYRQFLQFSPDEDPVPLARYEYMSLAATVDRTDPNARAQLARYAEDHGLPDVARDEFRNVLGMQPDNQVALQGLRRYADADFADAQAFFTDGQYLLARQKAIDVAASYPMFPDLTQAAAQLQAQAEVEQQKLQQNQQQQAVALALRGDDYYNQALSYISAMASTSVDRSQRVFSPRVEATKYLQRALYSWQMALTLDTTLGSPTSYDLYRKIADAYGRYVVLANPLPPRMPFRDFDRMSRGQDVREGAR